MAAATAKPVESDDDDFEEFEQDDWPETRKVDNTLWDEDWDTDEVRNRTPLILSLHVELLWRTLFTAASLAERTHVMDTSMHQSFGFCLFLNTTLFPICTFTCMKWRPRASKEKRARNATGQSLIIQHFS